MEAFWDPPSNLSGEITSYVVRVQYYKSSPGRFASLRKCRISDPAIRQWKLDLIPPQRPLYFQVQSVEHIEVVVLDSLYRVQCVPHWLISHIYKLQFKHTWQLWEVWIIDLCRRKYV